MGQWKYNTFGQDRKAAATAYREALAGADHAAWHYDLGLVLLYAGDVEAAKAAYSEGLQRAAGTVLQQAIRELRQALERVPDRPAAEAVLVWLEGSAGED
jgi:tetratricopeptide (TPR) repeat protein